jgi:hypothetical protein
MKTLMLTAIMALSLFAVVPSQKDAPAPNCGGTETPACPWVR